MAMLEQGAAPWQKPWRVASQMPRNLVSGKPYRGINGFLLHAIQYASPFWLTFKQAQALGGNVKRGEKSMPVVFWKKLETEDEQTRAKNPPLFYATTTFSIWHKSRTWTRNNPTAPRGREADARR